LTFASATKKITALLPIFLSQPAWVLKRLLVLLRTPLKLLVASLLMVL
jgi:hypothetical protein